MPLTRLQKRLHPARLCTPMVDARFALPVATFELAAGLAARNFRTRALATPA